MLQRIPVALFSLFFFIAASSQKITGIVTDSSGAVLPYSSIELKGRNISTTANAEGRFVISVSPGRYTLVCQHVGYQRQEKQVEVADGNVSVEFRMRNHESMLTEVIVKQGEDPAYEIIRNAIRKRPEFKRELDRFSVEVYTKGQLRLRDFPKKFMGEKVDFEDGDTSKRKIVYLSETVSQFSVEKPDHVKVEVVASRVSGQSDGFGLSAPNQLSFYENHIRLGNINPRGFISPVADNALNFYRYKYEGSFMEEGRQVNRIKVIPRRKYEPVFSGYINIIEDEWRIHSVQLVLTKDYAVELFDTLRLEQLYMPAGDRWVVKSQVIYPAIKIFGFDAHGSFANVYSHYQLNPEFPKGYFTSTVLKYTDSSNKRAEDYWEVNRPIVLQTDEVNDYRKKDSLEALRKLPAYRDSIDREGNKIKPMEVLLSGVSFSNSKKHSSIQIAPLIEALSYNTVEGTVVNFRVTYNKRLDTTLLGRRSFSITPQLRYGFENDHFNPRAALTYRLRGGFSNFSTVHIAGGRDVFQFNNDNPVNILHNTISTLFYGKNLLKIYEAGFATVRLTKGIGDGISLAVEAGFQNRIPLENSTMYTMSKNDSSFTPNVPLPLTDENIIPHQALTTSVLLRWQPGSKFIEFPGQKMSIGSKYPNFTMQLTQGIRQLFGSDIDYTKWLFRVTDQLNLRMIGSFDYRWEAGGFLQKNAVMIPDYTHFKGNTSDVAGSFGDRFQLVPHYYFSNLSSLYALVFTEHHFNGFLTNKIPGLKQLKWNLVAGAKALHISSGSKYAEPFVGLENIFKLMRIDYVWGFEKDRPSRRGFRIGMSSSLFGN